MTGPVSIPRRLASGLIRLAGRLLPVQRAEWANAMLAEFHYQDRDDAALVWALGCFIASITMRIETMIIGDLKISRWVLAPELLFCFAPLTLAWVDSIFGMSGVIRLNMEIIQQYFINTTTGSIVLVMMFSLAILGIIGLAGLLVAFRLTVLGRPSPRNIPGIILMTGPVVLGVIYVTSWLFIGAEFRLDYWGAILMFSILPALGATHMLYAYAPEQKASITT